MAIPQRAAWTAAVISGLAMMHPGSLAKGEVPGETIQQWLAALDEAQFVPIDEGAVEARRAAMRLRLQQWEAFIQMGGARKEHNWKRYLEWDRLRGMDQVESPDELAALEQIGGKLYTGHPGMELPAFVELREAVTRLVAILRVRGDERMVEAFRQQRDGLREELDALRNGASSQARRRVAERLEWFDSVSQLPDLIDQIRQVHRRPNLVVYASDALIHELVNQPVHEVSPVREVILGTRIYGTATTTGHVRAQLIPDARRARFAIHMSAVAEAQSLGYQGPVTIHSRSVTTLEGTKAMALSTTGLTDRPAQVDAHTRSQIDAISVRRRVGQKMIRRVAWKRAGQQRPLAEQIAAQRATVRAQASMDRRGQQWVVEGNDRLRSQLRQPLQWRGLYPDQVRLATGADAITASAVQARPRQLAASGQLPALERRTLSLLVHESLVNNSAEIAIGGMVLTDVQAAELAEELTGSVPEELQPGPDKDPWSITFAFRQPAHVAFDDDQIVIAIHGRRFTRGDRVLNRPVRIAATYRATPTPDGVRLDRQGELDVTFPGREGEQLAVREVAFKTFMTRKFDELFKAQFQGEGVELPGRLAQFGRRTVDHIAARQGWLNLGWK